MSDPIKYAEELPDNAVLKTTTAAGVSNVNYGPTSTTGWYNGLRTTGYTIAKGVEGASPHIYSPASDDEVIKFCNTTISPSPSTTITTIDEALDYIIKYDMQDFNIAYHMHIDPNLDLDLEKVFRTVTSVSYYGTTFFENVESKKHKRALRNREKAYIGSTLHFMRAIANNRLKEEKFKIYST